MTAMRPETTSEHIARDMREGRFPERSEAIMVPDVDDAWARIGNDPRLDAARRKLSAEELRRIIQHVLDALSTIPEQGVEVKPAAWQCEFFRADPSPRWHPELWLSDPRELYGNTLVRNVRPLYLSPSHPAAVAVTDEMVEEAHRLYADKVREYDRDFRSDMEGAEWKTKYGTNLHSTSSGERWAMKQALAAALRSTP